MQRFDVIKPRGLAEAAALLKAHGAAAHPLSGDGDVFPLLLNGAPDGRPARPRVPVNLAAFPGLNRVRYERGKGLRLGAMALVAEIQADRAVRDKYRGIAQAGRLWGDYVAS